MQNTNLSWPVVDNIAASLGASDAARRKWRQRGIPYLWQIKLATALTASGDNVDISAFERLSPRPSQGQAA